jgi:CheY-like chemotaxis protein
MKKNVDSEYPLLATAPRELGEPARRRARVLIAEDDYALRDLLLFAFENDGYEAVAVADGYAVLEQIGASLLPSSSVKPFDLLVSDIRMPRWNGFATIEKLSQSAMVPPLVVITAFGSEEVHRRAEHAGAVTVLDKPFDVQDLLNICRRVIQHPNTDAPAATSG